MSRASANDVIEKGWYIVVFTLLGGQSGAPNLGCKYRQTSILLLTSIYHNSAVLPQPVNTQLKFVKQSKATP